GGVGNRVDRDVARSQLAELGVERFGSDVPPLESPEDARQITLRRQQRLDGADVDSHRASDLLAESVGRETEEDVTEVEVEEPSGHVNQQGQKGVRTIFPRQLRRDRRFFRGAGSLESQQRREKS